MLKPFFEGSFPTLEEDLRLHFGRVRESWKSVSGIAQAMVLGGGYGRGEGGVELVGGEPSLFNDLDYFLFSETPEEPVLVDWCRRIEREETRRLGADVEIKRLPKSDVYRGLETMMFADLVGGHFVVAGDGGFLTELARSLDFSKVGAEDAARLLWNRGSGLLFSRTEHAGDPVFVSRNHAKLKLALGDAWLCLEGRYVSQCRERGRRFAACQLPEDLEVLHAWHQEAVEYKFRPVVDATGPDAVSQESSRLAQAWTRVMLRVESSRLGIQGLTLDRYLSLPKVFPGIPVWRNLAVAARDRLKRGGSLRPATDYPRGALMRALPCLLGVEGISPERARGFMPTRDGSLSEAYFRWWQHYC